MTCFYDCRCVMCSKFVQYAVRFLEKDQDVCPHARYTALMQDTLQLPLDVDNAFCIGRLSGIWVHDRRIALRTIQRSLVYSSSYFTSNFHVKLRYHLSFFFCGSFCHMETNYVLPQLYYLKKDGFLAVGPQFF